MKPRVIMIASCKGGVGKTTVTANLAMALALSGHRTLMLDCDLGMRCLDLVSGLSDSVTYDLCDCALGRVTPSEAAVTDPRCGDLFFIAAPYRYEGGLTDENFTAFIAEAIEELKLDYVLIDTHGGEGIEFALAAKYADLALVISTHQEAAVRAGEETARRLAELGLNEARLIINCYDKKAVKRGELPGVIDLIDRTRVRLVGVIPYDKRMTARQIDGGLAVTEKKNRAGIAVMNVAKRITGESVPLSVE